MGVIVDTPGNGAGKGGMLDRLFNNLPRRAVGIFSLVA
jgi:hypothetical protein